MNVTDADKIDRFNCPTCGSPYETRCRCMRGDSWCKNGHSWHVCFVHQKIVLGEANHSLDINQCTCKDNKNMITEQEYKKALAQLEEANQIISKYHEQSTLSFKEKWNKFCLGEVFFKDDELIYSAYSRCKKCGAGLAYPKDCDTHHEWTCSEVLKGTEAYACHRHDAYPFIMYEIKSENQPSANGATTRPK